jgi:KDO2-lipid IV(A) lauroyltransferase
MLLAIYKFFKFVFRYLVPGTLRYPLARCIARAVYRLNPARRHVILGNLTPLVGAERAAVLAPELFGNFLMTAVDFFCIRPELKQSVEREHWERLEQAYRETKRVMVVTAHLGHWEIGISLLLKQGYAVSGVYAPYTDDAIVQWIMSHRNPQAEWIPANRGAAESCIAALKAGRILGMVADIPFGERGQRIQIAGHPALLPIGPWAIAARARATVLPAFVIRLSPGHYRAIMHEPIKPVPGPLPKQIRRLQESYRATLETYLLEYPEQWGVLQPFWERPKS